MACGEGYGTDVLARTRGARSSASTRTPRRTSTPQRAYARPGVRFERTLIDTFDEPCDAVVFLQTIEHVTNPGEILEHFRELVAGSARRSSTSRRRTS